jgi:hypothetical protein
MRYILLLLFIFIFPLKSQAQTFNFPPEVDTREERIEYMYNLQEKLRLRHNFVGARYRNGLVTEQEWANFKTIHKQRQLKISKVINFLRWREEEDGSETILYNLDRAKRTQFLRSEKYEVDINDL